MRSPQLDRFRTIVRNLTPEELRGARSLRRKLLLASDGDIEVHYAPLDYINPGAKVVIVGITPGYTQMVNAIAECRRQMDAGANDEAALKAAKMTAAFSGSMQPNLVDMLDHIGLARLLRVASAAQLFGSANELVQTASVLKYPVFVRGENYNGTPNMLKQPLLRSQLLEGLGADVRNWTNALFIPLGDKVSAALGLLAQQGLTARDKILAACPTRRERTRNGSPTSCSGSPGWTYQKRLIPRNWIPQERNCCVAWRRWADVYSRQLNSRTPPNSSSNKSGNLHVRRDHSPRALSCRICGPTQQWQSKRLQSAQSRRGHLLLSRDRRARWNQGDH